MTRQHACCPTCITKVRLRQHSTLFLSGKPKRAYCYSGWALDASHVRGFTCRGLKRWQDWRCSVAATMLIRPWVQNGVFRGRDWQAEKQSRILQLCTCALIHTCFSAIIHSRCTHPHTHTAGAGWLSAVPGGLHWRGKGTERCFWLPAEPLSSGRQAPAPPGPHARRGKEVGGRGLMLRCRGGGCGPRMREQRENI